MKTGLFTTIAAFSILYGCQSSNSDDANAGAASEGGQSEGGQAQGGEAQGGAGEGGQGGQPSLRSIAIDVEVPIGSDADRVAVLVTNPAGEPSDTWLGSELPVIAQVHDGDLVWYLFDAESFSSASTFRVTPELTAVSTYGWLPTPEPPCQLGAPMTLLVEVPEVQTEQQYELRLVGANDLSGHSIEPGVNEVQLTACDSASSFDLLLLARGADDEPVAFARVDAIAYAPGSTSSLPITLSTERELTDVLILAEPGTTYGIHGTWFGSGFGDSGYVVTNEVVGTIDGSGQTSAEYGPFVLGAGKARVSVTSPPIGWTCELDFTWKESPFGGAPLNVRIGALAGFDPTPDGNVALAEGGEVGDVMIRMEDGLLDVQPARWLLHEDPHTSLPLPELPELPAGLLPGFHWPGAGAQLRYIHQDDEALDDYAAYAASHRQDMSGRARHRIPEECF